MRNLIATAVLAGLSLGTLADERGAKPKVKVNDLAFLTGSWRTDVWGGTGEEIWTKPESGNMIALWRFMKGGKLVFTEHVSLEEDAERGPVLRLKHFNPGMKGWEEKDESLTFYVEKFDTGDVHFAHEKDGRQVTLRYRAAGDALECTLVRTAGEKRDETVFRFTRAL
jgi:hypothetical protein